MKNHRNLLVYVIINIIISAITTLSVLWIWDRVTPVANAGNQPFINNCAPVNVENDEIPPPGERVIYIENVFGMADLEKEVVLLKRVGEGELWLTHWKLTDEKGHTYTFPRLLLNKNGAVQLFSRAGSDNVIMLYWGLTQPVWNSGASVKLFDPLNQLRAEFIIP